MRRLLSARSAAAALGVALLAATLMLAAGTSYAQRQQERDSSPTWRTKGSGGERARAKQGDRAYQDRGGRQQGGERANRGDVRYKRDGGRQQGGDRGYRGDVRYKGDGGRIRGGSGDRGYRGDDRGYRGGDRTYRGGDRSYRDRGGRGYYGGPRYYNRAPRYRGPSSYYYSSYPYWRPPVRYRYLRPRTFVSFGIGLGLPYYCPIGYRTVVVREPVVREYREEIQVENLPPPGCYYFDPICGQEFGDLDSYTDHIDREGHTQAIEIRDRDSGEYVRTLEFVGGYWVVQR